MDEDTQKFFEALSGNREQREREAEERRKQLAREYAEKKAAEDRARAEELRQFEEKARQEREEAAREEAKEFEQHLAKIPLTELYTESPEFKEIESLIQQNFSAELEFTPIAFEPVMSHSLSAQ